MPLINDMFQEENYGGERDLGHGEMNLVLGNLSKHRLSARVIGSVLDSRGTR